MTIEQELFASYRAKEDRLLEYGFEKCSDVFIYQKDFINDEFKALIFVNKNGEISGKVIEKEFNEEYSQLRIDSFHGEFVNKVREAYKDILINIRDKCFRKEMFVSNQANRLVKLIYEKYHESPDFPFDEQKYKNYGVFRYRENHKWYGLIMNVSKSVFLKNNIEEYVDVINVRIDEKNRDNIINNKNIFASYHMNKQKWVSIILDESLSDMEVMEFIDYSRNFMIGKNSRKKDN